ncbi:hypothetical protein KCP77_18950 [Salmonella enterica subsp. enterica]|nr:hypothetical protein KCP77_18950 [Salmonella enterica subsp. enterica]
MLLPGKSQTSVIRRYALFDKRRSEPCRSATRCSVSILHSFAGPCSCMTRAEVRSEQDYGQSKRGRDLEGLSLLLCRQALADVFIDG